MIRYCNTNGIPFFNNAFFNLSFRNKYIFVIMQANICDRVCAWQNTGTTNLRDRGITELRMTKSDEGVVKHGVDGLVDWHRRNVRT